MSSAINVNFENPSISDSIDHLKRLFLIVRSKNASFKVIWSNDDKILRTVVAGEGFTKPEDHTQYDQKHIKDYVKGLTDDGSLYKTFANEQSMNVEWDQIIKSYAASDSKETVLMVVKPVGFGLLCAAIAHAVMSRDGKESNKIIVGASGLAGFVAYTQGPQLFHQIRQSK